MLEKCKEQLQFSASKKLQEIYEITKNNQKHSTNDLLDGYAGVYLFQSKFEIKNNLCISTFNKNNLTYNSDNFGLGFSGQIWVDINVTPKEKIVYKEFISHLKKSAVIDFNDLHYNLVYGGIGKLICLIEYYKNHKVNNKTINTIANLILEKAITLGEGNTWYNNIYPYNYEDKNELNISMTQGIASIIMGLVILIPKVDDETKQKSKKVLLKCIKWIQSIEYNDVIGCKKFPTHYYSKDKQYIYFNRIGWAYGDITVAFSMYKASAICGNEDGINYSINLLKDIAKIKNNEIQYCVDASFSQGTGGVAHIFNRLYKETNIKEFDEARWYWLNETLKMSKFKDGYAGFKFWIDHKTGFQNHTGFYEGVSGIGLVLLGFLTDDIEDLSWDRCLLLS